MRGGVADGRPSLDSDMQQARRSWRCPEPPTGGSPRGLRGAGAPHRHQLADLAEEREDKRITFADTQAAPGDGDRLAEWSGSETGGRRYSPFTINVERLKPWHTLTGRQHFYLDHEWMPELGEGLPAYRPPLDMNALFGEPQSVETGELGVTVRYLTPHSKWSIHSEYQDNLHMLTLSRGGPTMWMSRRTPRRSASPTTTGSRRQPQRCRRRRAIVSHRMPKGTVFMYHAQDRTRRPQPRPRAARRHPQLADPAPDEAHPPDRRLRPAVVRVQLPRPDREPARRDHRDPPRSQEVEY